eukprot:COSAG05_NODE_4262_length_1592_cov_504.841929_2_plen_94_part_00
MEFVATTYFWTFYITTFYLLISVLLAIVLDSYAISPPSYICPDCPHQIYGASKLDILNCTRVRYSDVKSQWTVSLGVWEEIRSVCQLARARMR